MNKLLDLSLNLHNKTEKEINKELVKNYDELNKLFFGVDESVLMQESLEIVKNDQSTFESKEIALDNFIMMIENQDNANNIENMNMWDYIIELLHSNGDIMFRIKAAMIIRTAVENNPKCQEVFCKFEKGISGLVNECISSSNDELLANCLYALSSLILNNAECKDKFIKLDGFKVLKTLENPSEKIQIKTLSLISSILSSGINESTTNMINNYSLINFIIKILSNSSNIICIDVTLLILTQLLDENFVFSDEQSERIKKTMVRIGEMKDKLNTDNFNLVLSRYSHT